MERVDGDSSCLTLEELNVYHPMECILPLANINVVLHKDGTTHRCLTGSLDLSDHGYPILPLWKLDGQRISEMNTQASPVSAIDGLVCCDWVNEVLNKGADEATSATMSFVTYHPKCLC